MISHFYFDLFPYSGFYSGKDSSQTPAPEVVKCTSIQEGNDVREVSGNEFGRVPFSQTDPSVLTVKDCGSSPLSLRGVYRNKRVIDEYPDNQESREETNVNCATSFGRQLSFPCHAKQIPFVQLSFPCHTKQIPFLTAFYDN